MFSSLRFRLWLNCALVMVVVIIIAGIVVVYYLINNPVEARIEYQKLRLTSPIITRRLNLIIQSRGSIPFTCLIDTVLQANESLNVRVVLFQPDGSLVMDSREDFAPSLLTLVAFQKRTPGSVKTIRDSEQEV